LILFGSRWLQHLLLPGYPHTGAITKYSWFRMVMATLSPLSLSPLSAALRKGDTVARFGGDEFMLILPDLEIIEDAIQVAQKIVDSFRKPFLIDSQELSVTTSIGIAVYPNDGTDEGILLKNADIAMYQAKQAGRDRYQIYKKV
jgi:diguanylate cyclase (GGDEF)-like protein